MRITRQTATELQLEDSGRAVIAFGLVAIVFAVLAAVVAMNDGRYAAAAIVLGGFGSTGIVILRRAEAAVHHFDLQRGILTVDTRPALAVDEDDRKAVTYPLRTLADVALEASGREAGDGDLPRTLRPVYVFSDGSRLPLVPYYTAQRSKQEAIQAAVRSILGAATARSA